ncbi:MAG: DUF2878 domain-containing protein [Granulosicoccaceae bacterium]
MHLLILDALCLQVAWFTAAILQDSSTPWLCALLLLRIGLDGGRWHSLKPALLVATAGVSLELFMIQAGLSQYNSATHLPVWLPLLWVLFGFTFGRSMNWLLSSPLPLQSALGALAGTLTYFSANAFGVLDLKPAAFISALCLAILWAAALPLFAGLYRQSSWSTEQ